LQQIKEDAVHDVRAGARDLVRGDDERFMRLAIAQAWLGKRTPGAGEVGCVIVREGEVLSEGHNEAEMLHDPTAHAEIVTLTTQAGTLITIHN
jgi:tRNA(adenine34) deaminase